MRSNLGFRIWMFVYGYKNAQKLELQQHAIAAKLLQAVDLGVIHNSRAGGGVGLLERDIGATVYKGTKQWTDRATHLENKARMLE